ncbi:hypothetical protein BC826DRAFT_1108825 [Russula brevipes]|nr:hypothetical protein BC826DRAFT_1108825 [Russula brevipes]
MNKGDSQTKVGLLNLEIGHLAKLTFLRDGMNVLTARIAQNNDCLAKERRRSVQSGRRMAQVIEASDRDCKAPPNHVAVVGVEGRNEAMAAIVGVDTL